MEDKNIMCDVHKNDFP